MDVDRLLELDRAHVWHPYAPARGGVPVYPVRSAAGVRITLADGRSVIDGMATAPLFGQTVESPVPPYRGCVAYSGGSNNCPGG